MMVAPYSFIRISALFTVVAITAACGAAFSPEGVSQTAKSGEASACDRAVTSDELDQFSIDQGAIRTGYQSARADSTRTAFQQVLVTRLGPVQSLLQASFGSLDSNELVALLNAHVPVVEARAASGSSEENLELAVERMVVLYADQQCRLSRLSPSPTPTPLPTATPGPNPTPTPQPTATPGSTPMPTPTPTPTPMPSPTPAPTPTPMCNQTIYNVFIYGSAPGERAFFSDQQLMSPQGKVIYVTGTGKVAFFSCVDYGGANGVQYLIRNIIAPYTPSTGGCSESLHGVFNRSTQLMQYKAYFQDAQMSLAAGAQGAVIGTNGYALVLKCNSAAEGFTVPTIALKY